MVFPHRPAGFAGGPAPIPVYGWDLFYYYSLPRMVTFKFAWGRPE
jgi:hypothetical protein